MKVYVDRLLIERFGRKRFLFAPSISHGSRRDRPSPPVSAALANLFQFLHTSGGTFNRPRK